eukprot:4544020-Amphidinium_carterae.1
MTIGMIGLQHPTDNEAQPVDAGTPTTLATSRAMRQSQAGVCTKTDDNHPSSFFVSLLMTILLCIHYSYFGSTISPLATARKSFATMAGIPGDFTMLPEGQEVPTSNQCRDNWCRRDS